MSRVNKRAQWQTLVWRNRVGQTVPALVCARAIFEKCPTVPSVSCVYKLRSVVNGLAAGGLFNAVPVSLVAKSWAVSLLHFVPVADERRGRPLIWACQRMELPSSLSREKEEIQPGSVSCWWKQKNFIRPLLLISCAICLFWTLRSTLGWQHRDWRITVLPPCCRHRCWPCHFQGTRVCVPTALHLMCHAALCSISAWRLVIPAWHCLLADCVGGKSTLIFCLSPSLLSFSGSLH